MRARPAVRTACAAAALAALGASPARGEPPSTEERTVCEWVVEPRYVGAGAPKLEPQRVCRTETVQRPAAPPPPEGLRPAGGSGTGIVVESEPSGPAPQPSAPAEPDRR